MGHLRTSLTDDEAAEVSAVFEEHRQLIEAVATKYAVTADHVPDIVQTVGVHLCAGLNGFRRQAQFRTWLYRMTANVARSYYDKERGQRGLGNRRHRRRNQAIDASDLQFNMVTDINVDPEETLQAEEQSAALSDAIEQLPPRYQAAIRNVLEGSADKCSSRWTRLRATRRLRIILAQDPRVE